MSLQTLILQGLECQMKAFGFSFDPVENLIDIENHNLFVPRYPDGAEQMPSH